MASDKDRDLKELISSDPDFVNNRKYNFSLRAFLLGNPDGATDRQIANLLKVPLEDVQAIYENIILKLRQKFGIDEK